MNPTRTSGTLRTLDSLVYWGSRLWMWAVVLACLDALFLRGHWWLFKLVCYSAFPLIILDRIVRRMREKARET